MQFNRQSDGTMQPLPKPSIDTGMGLERISAILQNVHSNYEIDIFQYLIEATANIVGVEDKQDKSLRVIADHIRSCSFLICDGIIPSNEGRGYVLRRIIRRAVRHGNKLGASDVFFYRLVEALENQMADAYPELTANRELIEKVLKTEEEQFIRTLERGMNILNDALKELTTDVVPGELVFKLYDTYGFPADLTNDVAREKELRIDEEGFKAAMAAQRKRAQQASNFDTDYNELLKSNCTSEFTGYDQYSSPAKIVELFTNGQQVEQLSAGEEGVVVLDNSPFYAESGGQVGDSGLLKTANGSFAVRDTVKLGNAIAHKGTAHSELKLLDVVQAEFDVERREAIKLNHTATHLMHAALKKVLGEHVNQKGSLVTEDRFRFDFSHFEAVTNTELQSVEKLVNEQIRVNHVLKTQLMNLDEAKTAGAMALFGEKYAEDVRVVSMGDFSMELCGGTHVDRTGDIGFFKIISEGGIAAGVRRIEAVTGEKALEVVQAQGQKMNEAAGLLKTDTQNLSVRIKQVLDQNKLVEKELEKLKQQIASNATTDVLSDVYETKGVKVLSTVLQGVEAKALRSMVDDFKNQLGSAIIVLGIAEESKVSLIVGVTKDLVSKVKAGELVNFVAQQVGGKGGGRPDMAQAGGTQPQNLDSAIASVKSWLEEKL
jgi:alanyl-tRNA synthetase